MKIFRKKNTDKNTKGLTAVFKERAGFSLVECVIAMVVLLIASLAVISVLNYSLRNNESSRKRFAALLLAEYRLEVLRNQSFNDLAAGTTTEENVVNDGVSFKVVTSITENDILTTTSAPGPETKKIVIIVSPDFNTFLGESITLTTIRSKNNPGPNREENNP